MSDSSANTRISLLLVSHSYPPVIGGSEMEAQRVCEALIKRGHSVKVVCAGGAPMPDTEDWIDPKGVPVRIYGRHQTGALKDLVFALQVGRMLIRERRNYQLVYFLMQGLHLALGLPVARSLKKPILMKISSSIVIPILSKSLSGRMELDWLRKWARYVMILNDGVRQQAIDQGFSPQKLGMDAKSCGHRRVFPGRSNRTIEATRQIRCTRHSTGDSVLRAARRNKGLAVVAGGLRCGVSQISGSYVGFVGRWS